MTSYAVFFSNPAAIGLQRVEAADAAEAEEMVLDQYQDAQVHAVDGALVTEENRHRLLAAWINRLDGAEGTPQDLLRPLISH